MREMRVVLKDIVVLVFLSALMAFGTPLMANADQARELNNFEIEASGSWASPPASGFQNGSGANFGAGVMLNQEKTVQARIDFSPLQWKRSYFGSKLVYTKQAITAGIRYYMSTYSDTVKLIGQAGIEVSADKKESMVTFPNKITTKKTRMGITPGIGFEFGIGPNAGIIIMARYHIITDKYADAMAGLAVHF